MPSYLIPIIAGLIAGFGTFYLIVKYEVWSEKRDALRDRLEQDES